MKLSVLSLALAAILASCSGQGSAITTEAAINEFGAVFDAFREDPYPEFPVGLPGRTSEKVAAYYDESEKRLARLDVAFGELLSAVREERSQDAKFDAVSSVPVGEFTNLLGHWLETQKEQLSRSRECVQRTASPFSCMSQTMIMYGDRWQAAATALDDALPDWRRANPSASMGAGT